MKYYLQTPLKNLSFLFLFLFCTSSLVRAQEKHTLKPDDVIVSWGVIRGCKPGFTDKDIIIPKTIGGQTITGISGWAFYSKDLTSVTFPDDSRLTTIGGLAFMYNYLTEVKLPASLTSIGFEAFSSNELETVLFLEPSNIQSIGAGAFSYNSSLTEIELPTHSNDGFIGYEDSDRNEYDSGEDFTEFSSSLWVNIEECYTLSSEDLTINIHGVITECSYDFANKCIIIPSTYIDGNGKQQDITGIDGRVTYRKGIFENKGLISVKFPASLKTIGERAFAYNQFTALDLSSLDNLNTIAKKAFYNESEENAKISELTLPSSKLTAIGDYAFFDNVIEDLFLPSTLETIGASAFFSNELELVNFESPSNIQSIGQDAFSSNSLLTEIILPTFPEDSKHNVYIARYGNNEQKYYPGQAFPRAKFGWSLEASFSWEECYTLSSEDLTINIHGVITECSYDFANKCIIIPSTYIDGNGKQQDITGIDGRVTYRKGIFENKGLISVKFPASLKTIGERAFAYNQFTALDLSSLDNLNTIAKKAFYNESEENAKISELTLPSSKLTTIGDYAFFDNVIEDLFLPSTLETIGVSAFFSNELELVNFESPSNIQSIGQDAFSSNSLLTEIILPTFPEDSKHNVYIARYGNNEQKYYLGQAFPRAKFGWSLEASFSWEECYTLSSEDLTINIHGVITECSYDFANKCIIIPSTYIDDNGKQQDITGISDRIEYRKGIFENKGLISVKFPASLKTIGGYAFHNNLLEELSFAGDSKLESIGFLAFVSNNLKKISLPPSLKTIGSIAFALNKLEEVTFDLDEDGKSSIQSIGDYAFYGNNNLGSITLPDNNNENFLRYIDIVGETYEVGDSFYKFHSSYSIVTSDPSSSRLASHASHSDVEILEQPQPFTYYPNPVVSQLTVTANVGDRILMLNQVGVTVYDEVVTSIVAHQIDVTDFPRGVYLIRLISAEGSVITKRLAKH